MTTEIRQERDIGILWIVRKLLPIAVGYHSYQCTIQSALIMYVAITICENKIAVTVYDNIVFYPYFLLELTLLLKSIVILSRQQHLLFRKKRVK